MKCKSLIIALILQVAFLPLSAQGEQKPFTGTIYNENYKVRIEMNLYENKLTIPSQEIFGEVPGYISSENDSRKWIIVEADINQDIATLSIINDYGSEDLHATLKKNSNGTYTLIQKDGSSIKFAVNRKWQKLPKQLTFKRQ